MSESNAERILNINHPTEVLCVTISEVFSGKENASCNMQYVSRVISPFTRITHLSDWLLAI